MNYCKRFAYALEAMKGADRPFFIFYILIINVYFRCMSCGLTAHLGSLHVVVNKEMQVFNIMQLLRVWTETKLTRLIWVCLFSFYNLIS